MITYRSIQENDLPVLTELYSKYLNSGEYISQSTRTAFERGEYAGRAAEVDGQIAGFMTLRAGIVLTYPHEELEDELNTAAGGQRVWCCDALLVLPEYRIHGISHELARRCAKQLVEMGVSCFLAEIWIYPDGRSPAKRIFESMGHVTFQKKVPMFYRDQSLYGITCPFCGEHCVCGAWLELIALRDGDGPRDS